MSKASEYAKKFGSLPELDIPLLGASVTTDGDLLIMPLPHGFTYLSPERAIKLAEWIYDTFGEKDD